jgi:hypothetical protein
MSSRTSNHINRVIKEMNRKHPCQLCHGEGKIAVTTLRNGEELPPEDPGCPGCGKVLPIVLQYVRVSKIWR